MTSLVLTENVIFRPSYDPGGGGTKLKFEILTAYLQEIHNYILEYQWSTPENQDVVQGTNFTEETPFFDPHLTPGDKMKILKPYCIYTRHSQSYPMNCSSNNH